MINRNIETLDLSGNSHSRKHPYRNIEEIRRLSQEDAFYKGIDGDGIPMNRHLNVLIPTTGDKSPGVVWDTVRAASTANEYAKRHGIEFCISSVMLCDQSPDNVASRNVANMQTMKDVLQRQKTRGVEVPGIFHLRIGEETDKVLMQYASKHYGKIIERGEGGKGYNLLTSVLATGGNNPDDEIGLIFIDSDNMKVGDGQIFSLGAPIFHMTTENPGYRCVISDNDRFHMQIDEETGANKKMLGSRVDNSAIIPLNNTLFDGGLLKDKLNKYCTGERAMTRDLFFSFETAQKYGFEQVHNLQLLSEGSDFNTETGLYEVFVGQNQDDAIGAGMKPKDILYGIAKMTNQILGVTKGMIDKDKFFERWETPEEFMQDFKENQDYNAEGWALSLGKGMDDYVTGGVKIEELLDFSRLLVEANIRELYEEGSRKSVLEKIKKKYVDVSDTFDFSDEILVPLDEVRKYDEGNFRKLIRVMTSRRYTIHD